MKIIKIFNNNSIAALSDELGDIILTGSGIGFQKKIGDLVDESRIEKTYIFKEKGEKRIHRGINDIEPIYYEITSLLVSKATEQLNTQFYGEIFLAISDHIAFAIKRKKEKIDLNNLAPEEELKYEIAKELGLLDKVMEQGWKALTAKETGRIGGLMTRRRREEKKSGM